MLEPLAEYRNVEPEINAASKDQPKITINQQISFQQPDGQPCTATILSRAGKSTGRYAKWYNIKYSSPESQAGKISNIDLSAVDNLELQNTETEPNLNKATEVLELQHNQFDDAKQAELQSWKDNCVYEEVPYTQQKCISTRWVCSLKPTDQGLKPKGRLVARGFEEYTANIEKESPTCAKDTLQVMISIINQNKWKLKSIDIKTAFLQGEVIGRNVYLRPPTEAKCTKQHIWKLKKCVYGLSDASLK